MKNNLRIRPAEPKDSQEYSEWLRGTEGNLVDYGVYSYPTTTTLVVESEDGPELMNSFQLVIVPEALATKPGLSPMREARALKLLNTAWENVAQNLGIREIYFNCADSNLGEFVSRHGWEKLQHPVYRRKLKTGD